MKKTIFLVLLGLLALNRASLAQVPEHPEFKAEARLLVKSKVVDRGSFYMGKERARLELVKQTQIVDSTKNLSWVVLPGNTCLEAKVDFNPVVNSGLLGLSESCEGQEEIEGRVTNKCRVNGVVLGKPVSSTIWRVPDLGGAVVKNLDDKGNGMEIAQIAVGTQDPGIFELPPNCKIVPLPDKEKVGQGVDFVKNKGGSLLKGLMK